MSKVGYIVWVGVGIALTGAGILFADSAANATAFPWSDFYKALASGLIGAGAVTAVLRIAIDRELEASTAKAIADVTASNLSMFQTELKDGLKGRTDFDPVSTFTSRLSSDDRVEREIRSILLSSQMFTSFGISGQYAVARLLDVEGISRTCSVKIIVSDPRLLNDQVFGNVDEVKNRISGCIQLLLEIGNSKSWDVEVFFSHPIPSLRFDIFSQETFVYAFDDQHRPEQMLPDAAKFSLGTQWDRTSRQMALDAERVATAGWRRATGPWALGVTGRPEAISIEGSTDQATILLAHIGLKPLGKEELKALEEQIKERAAPNT